MLSLFAMAAFGGDYMMMVAGQPNAFSSLNFLLLFALSDFIFRLSWFFCFLGLSSSYLFFLAPRLSCFKFFQILNSSPSFLALPCFSTVLFDFILNTRPFIYHLQLAPKGSMQFFSVTPSFDILLIKYVPILV